MRKPNEANVLKAAAVCLMMLSHITRDFGKFVFPIAYNYIKV